MVDGATREYRVHAPPGYEPSRRLPLVLAFHCRPCDIDVIAQLSDLSAKADEEDFVVVYPQGKGRRFTSSDVGFIEALLDEVESTWGTDPDEVYATGFSNGAAMTFRVAADLPGRFAAVAPVSGSLHAFGGGQLSRVLPAGVSMVVFTGLDDSAIDQGVKVDLAELRQALGCEPPSVKRTSGARSVTITAAMCRNSADIVWYSVAGMGHTWPGTADGLIPDPDGPVKATDVMWQFFESHPRTT